MCVPRNSHARCDIEIRRLRSALAAAEAEITRLQRVILITTRKAAQAVGGE